MVGAYFITLLSWFFFLDWNAHTHTYTHKHTCRQADDNMNTHGPLTLPVSQEPPAVESQSSRQSCKHCCGSHNNTKELSVSKLLQKRQYFCLHWCFACTVCFLAKLLMFYHLHFHMYEYRLHVWGCDWVCFLGMFGILPIHVSACICECDVRSQTGCSHVPENEANQIGQTVYFQTRASGLLPHTHSNTSRQTFRSGN